MTSGQSPMGEIAPHLEELGRKVLFGDIWERPILSKRERSLITVAVLMALYRPAELSSHIRRALTNGVTKEELGELITHIAFYGGWPTAANASRLAKEVFDEG